MNQKSTKITITILLLISLVLTRITPQAMALQQEADKLKDQNSCLAHVPRYFEWVATENPNVYKCHYNSRIDCEDIQGKILNKNGDCLDKPVVE